jgi:2-aminoethylphosphonate-pyruvate transaminase
MMNSLPNARDKLLFTPGPLTTSPSVKQAMLHDPGSWDIEFNAVVAEVRTELLRVAGVTKASGWEAILLQGSGTYGVEAVFQTSVPRTGKVAVLTNGAYGDRMERMLAQAGIAHTVLRTPEDEPVDVSTLARGLDEDAEITHVAMVHCETTTGMLNPIEVVGQVSKAFARIFIVDAMSSFGGIPLDLEACHVDYLVSSANKCLEGVPGLCFVLCRRPLLEACEGNARCLSLDLLAQWRGFEANGQFRFTPPTHAVLALRQALHELELEEGVRGRAARYRRNHEVLIAGMEILGLTPYLKSEVQSHIITAFPYPNLHDFAFSEFYRSLSQRGFLIYPGKLTQVDTFRIGTIGRLFPEDLEQLVQAIRSVLRGFEAGEVPDPAQNGVSNLST